MTTLKGETLKLWLYLAKNQDDYQLELSQKALAEWGLKKDAYYTAKKKLIEVGYLTPLREGSNILVFSEIPKKWMVILKIRKVFWNSEKFSEKP